MLGYIYIKKFPQTELFYILIKPDTYYPPLSVLDTYTIKRKSDHKDIPINSEDIAWDIDKEKAKNKNPSIQWQNVTDGTQLKRFYRYMYIYMADIFGFPFSVRKRTGALYSFLCFFQRTLSCVGEAGRALQV